MIGYAIFFGSKPCFIEEKNIYAICRSEAFAKGYAEELTAVSPFVYVAKKVSIEVLE
jgi:ATP-dependent exoDNAse (exonuclease V) beta subunit